MRPISDPSLVRAEYASEHALLALLEAAPHRVLELQRVIRSGGRLVAITNGRDLAEVWGPGRSEFDDESREEALRRSFTWVERRDVSGTVVFATRAGLTAYVGGFSGFGRQPVRAVEDFSLPLQGTLRNCVFVADKAR